MISFFCRLQDEIRWTVIKVGLRTCGTKALCGILCLAEMRASAAGLPLFLEALNLTLCYCAIAAGSRERGNHFRDPRGSCWNFHKTEVIIKTQWSGTIARENTISSRSGRGRREVCFQGKDLISPLVRLPYPQCPFPSPDVFESTHCSAVQGQAPPQRPSSQMIHAVQPSTFGHRLLWKPAWL